MWKISHFSPIFLSPKVFPSPPLQSLSNTASGVAFLINNKI